MKLSVEKSLLVEVLGAIAPAARGEYPIKLTAGGSKITAVATNAEVTISSSGECGVTDDGTVLVGHKALVERVRSLAAGPVELSVDGNQLTVASGRSRFRVATVSTDAMPVLTVPQGDATVVSASTLFDALRQVTPACSNDVSRAALCGVYFDPSSDGDGVTLVATDSYRLAVRKLDGTGITSSAALVPAAALVALERAASRDDEIAVRADDRQIAFSGSTTVVVARLIAATYPQYGGLLGGEAVTEWKLPAGDLVDALKRAEVVLKGTSTAVRIELDAETVRISAAQGGEDYTEEFPGTGVTGDPVTFAVNPAFLRAGIEAAAGDDVTVGVVAPLKPILVGGGSSDITYLVMPQRA